MMNNIAEGIRRMFEEEYLTISLPTCLENLLVKELKKYIIVLKMELEATELTAEIIKDIENAETLKMRLLFAFRYKHKTIEVTIAEALQLANMLYCSITFLQRFPLFDSAIMEEYLLFNNSLSETLKILSKNDIERYKRSLRGGNDMKLNALIN